ncbi:MAG: hypothetical protein R3F14_07705 [Polyangiaceae bacterium]
MTKALRATAPVPVAGPTKIFAAREWTHEGGIFADFQLLTSEGCDGAAALYWPGKGWVAALTDGPVLRAQILGENGGHRWPDNGFESTGNPTSKGRGLRPTLKIADGDVVEISVGAKKTRVPLMGQSVK